MQQPAQHLLGQASTAAPDGPGPCTAHGKVQYNPAQQDHSHPTEATAIALLYVCCCCITVRDQAVQRIRLGTQLLNRRKSCKASCCTALTAVAIHTCIC